MTRGLATPRTRAFRTDARAPAWNLGAMPKSRKRSAFELFLEALTKPVRFR